MAEPVARRVTIHPDGQGGWSFYVQSMNWRTMFRSGASAEKRSTIERLVARRWPNVEVVIQE